MDDTKELLQNGAIVSDLYRIITYDLGKIKHVPGMVKRLIKEKRWKTWLNPSNEAVYHFKKFSDFVEAKPYEGGLGTTVAHLLELCQHDEESITMIRSELGPRRGNPTGANQYASGITYNISNSTDPVAKTGGTSAIYGLDRLDKAAKSNPKAKRLQQKVFEQEISVNAALIELGLRKKTLTIPLDGKRAARSIKRHFSPEEIEELICHLRS